MTDVHERGLRVAQAAPRTGTNIIGALDEAGARFPTARWHFPQQERTLRTGELLTGAGRVGSGLLQEGVRPGDVVGLLLPPGLDAWVGILGTLASGGVVSALAVHPFHSRPEEEAAQISRIAESASMHHLIVGPEYEDITRALARIRPQMRSLSIGELSRSGTSCPADAGPDDLAVVQFTSGSTSTPKGVMLSHTTVLAGLNAINEGLATSPQDVVMQWVPHHHDMGLMSPLAVALAGADVHITDPVAFISRPADFLDYFAAHRGTMMAGPNFSYDRLTAAVAERAPGTWDLSSWRLSLNGAEPVKATTVHAFTRTMKRFGVGEHVMLPVYGMAEVTLAATFPALGSLPRVLHVDRRELESSGTLRITGSGPEESKALVSVGRPVHGLSLRIAGPEGRPLPEGTLGEIQLRGPSVTHGYLGNPAETAQALSDGWLSTGDVGCVWDGELYVTGRSKDMIIVNGRNIFPEDVEALVRTVPGVHRGRNLVVCESDTERLEVVAETADPEAVDPITEEVNRVVSDVMGIDTVEVRFVPPGGLPRTANGKWQRAVLRSRLADGS